MQSFNLQRAHRYAENGHSKYGWSLVSFLAVQSTQESELIIPKVVNLALFGSLSSKPLSRQHDILGLAEGYHITLWISRTGLDSLILSQAEVKEKCVAREATTIKKFTNTDRCSGEVPTRQKQRNKRESKSTQYLTRFSNLPTFSGQGERVFIESINYRFLVLQILGTLPLLI